MTERRKDLRGNLILLGACLVTGTFVLDWVRVGEIGRPWLLVVAGFAAISAIAIRRMMRLIPPDGPDRPT